MERAPGMATKRKCPDGETETACGAGLCVMGCGFFGSAATMNMCSRCYREHVLATADIGGDAAAMLEEAANPELMGVFASAPPEKKARSSVSVAATPPAASDATAAAAMEKAATRELTDVFACAPPEKEARPSVAVAAAAPSPAAAETKAATTNRCMSCRKKVGLTGFKCRCGGTFCGAHRYADEHTCSFDYKSAGREQIAQQNPVVVSDKMTTRI